MSRPPRGRVDCKLPTGLVTDIGYQLYLGGMAAAEVITQQMPPAVERKLALSPVSRTVGLTIASWKNRCESAGPLRTAAREDRRRDDMAPLTWATTLPPASTAVER
jgi:hypothetical protein